MAAHPTIFPFADAALDLLDRGLAPIPLGGDDGKVPLVRWKRWKHPLGRQSLGQLADKHPTANVGVLTGLSGVTVVDVDDLELTDAMVRRFGDTPLQTSTPSGGVHLWFRSSGERCRTRLDGLKVDIRGEGGMVVVPPSIRPSGPHAGKAYGFLEGTWDDLPRLPEMKVPALATTSVSPAAGTLQTVQQGNRDNSLFRACLDLAPRCDTFDDLVDEARTINESYAPPLSDARVVAKAKSAWQCQVEGRNWRGHGAHVTVAERTIDRLLAHDPRHGPDALSLYLKLRAKHGARDQRREAFAVAARAMARDLVLPWTEGRIRRATQVLVNFGLLALVKEGGHGEGDAHQYRFCTPPPALVSENDTNVIRHPPRRSPGREEGGHEGIVACNGTVR